MPSGISIGVVGGGAAAVCLIDALARSEGEPGSLTVFEPSPHLWRGRAYQIDTEILRVNATADDMSVRAGDPGHFERWLRAHDRVTGVARDTDRLSGARFAPRAVYGDYLEDSAYAALGRLRRDGWRVDIVGEAVKAAGRMPGQVLLGTGPGRTRAFDYAVLCVGGDSPKDVYELGGTPGFIADPYPLSATLAEVGEDDHVAVIGSGLTAIDIVLSLASRGHRGPISLMSRRGVLPGVRQRPTPLELRHMTPVRVRTAAQGRPRLTIEDVAAVLRAEFRDAGADLDGVIEEIIRVDLEDPVDRLRRQLGEVDSPQVGMRILQRAVPETGPDVWPLLREEDKVQVLRAHYRTLMSLCCPMPPSSATVVLDLVQAGRLEMFSGLLDITAAHGSGFDILAADGTAFRADKVISAVNASEGRIPSGALPLVTSLVKARAVSRHPHGGLQLARATSRLTSNGRPDPRLYGLGNIAAGALFFTFGIPSLVDRSQDIVAAILEHRATVDAARSEAEPAAA
ncbi:FAD/NAD(P)-binding protein [Streptomyces sp. NBC_01314]|uniref:FAD/NAD(P)-binding protein n=1 Tax=Streptomyces sp. NBC_01314 TaxID=2903821 RepID=UPI0030889705|nr:FAD/NAD(P)-binding protein [Streptomyces sp. NBC_01314]WRZ54374.1 FAD/NAD(P)-binding protein [Streptomyces sp. NBC_01314]